jgi:tRNA-2-methylthio-N6-dimethylallyladenosine synthase
LEQSTCSIEATYSIETWGCQMNVLDGERMAGRLEAAGATRASDPLAADVVIFNTCAVREKSEHKVYSALGLLARRKQERPELVIGVTGCVAQVSGDEILERAPWVDFVLGTGQVESIAATVARVRQERRRLSVLELPQDSPSYAFREIRRDSSFHAYLTVIEGCDQFCTFCIVPFTRGRERSRRSGEILTEAAELVANGYTEITLLGQTVNAYRDPEDSSGLGSLLRRCAAIPGLRRLRFITSHPNFLDEGILEAMASGPPVAPFLHMPAQSGSDAVLYRMKRRYDAAGYLEKLIRARRAVPDLAVSSDFIVGFPGETDADFEATLALLREARFDSIFAFRYSPRPGTASARWGREKQVPEALSGERLSRLLALQNEIQAEHNRGLEGRAFEVLVEGKDPHGNLRGRTPCNRVVQVEEAAAAPGSYLWATVTRGLPNSLTARRTARPSAA